MKSYIMAGPRALEPAELGVPELTPGCVLLKTLSVSICATDVGYYRGCLKPPGWPIIPGHEYLGEVVESQVEGEALRPGDKLVYWGQTDFGGLAEYRVIRPIFPGMHREMQWLTDRHFMDDHQAAAVLVDDDVPLENATLIEPLTSVLRAILEHPPRPGDDVIILGAGPCGLLGAQVLRRMFGVRHITILERNPARLDFARAAGIELALDVVREEEAIHRLIRDSQGAHAHYLFDALPDISGLEAGPSHTRALGMQLLAPHGCYLLYGATEQVQPVDTWLILSKGLRLVSTPFDVRHFSMARSASVMNVARTLVARRFLELESLVTQTIAFGDVAAIRSVFDHYGQDAHLKTVISVARPVSARLPVLERMAA
ncbi:MAG TPA: alcohol dehydrogenase catalytic domain-containing protein [Archangium sp.]|uniref:zinc-dependent alcohol dehydrogenase n=1 Tax=Archangium sp. TaxID=1872627 RepID=UPI002E35BB43|nr:alcohol dehydrogenase catalytic domain-containing protein [Archangium sp.]HEX5747838.1 alcohol dehydrogenase catalytic domain-containing protein [Archangium sp.]